MNFVVPVLQGFEHITVAEINPKTSIGDFVRAFRQKSSRKTLESTDLVDLSCVVVTCKLCMIFSIE